ncbi:MAG: hypothetical protein KUG82_16735 [Pseudomonadales bacterium]|nr:hypothetical protein [Pseudomonadales bacterium]
MGDVQRNDGWGVYIGSSAFAKFNADFYYANSSFENEIDLFLIDEDQEILNRPLTSLIGINCTPVKPACNIASTST